MAPRVSTIIKQLDKRKVALAAERDKLRALIGELEDLEDTARRAEEALGEAVQALSELV